MDDRDRALAKAMFNEVPRRVEWAEATATTRMRWLLRAQEIRKRMEQDEPKSRLIPEWRDVLKRAHSIKLAVAAPFVIEALWYVLSSAPPELRVFISLPIYFALAGAAVLARIWNQPAK